MKQDPDPPEEDASISTVRKDTGRAPDVMAGNSPDAAVPDSGSTPRDMGGGDIAPSVPRCSAPADRARPIEKLTQTGCVDPMNPLKPSSSVILYEVNSPLWSDGTAKDRYVAIPPGKKVTIKDCKTKTCPPMGMTGFKPYDDGHLEFPAGTVLVKNFGVGNKRIETRLLVLFDNGRWGMYSYQWNDAQTEATVIPDDESVQKQFPTTLTGPGVTGGMQTWTYPSRIECTKCHTEAAGYQLGLSLVQLNRTITYPDGTKMNQLDYWKMKGLWEAAPATPYPAPLPNPLDPMSGTLEQRARSYLHANCGVCHRPYGAFEDFDARWATPFKDTRMCNGVLSKSNLGIANARRLVPGAPDRSIISRRMHSLEASPIRMPELASSVVDVPGVKVIDDWITALKACPQ